MNYSTAFKYIFDNPKWGVNVLLGGVCHLIPVVGPIVFQGYICEVIDARLTPMGDTSLAPTAPGEPLNYQVPIATYPNFDFNRFGEYLIRGLWPFLVSLIMVIPMVFSFVLLYIAIIVTVAAKLHGIAAVLFFLCAFGMYLLIVVVMPIAMTPFILRAMLTRNFAAAFDFKFAMDFLRREGIRALLNTLVTMVVSLPLMIIGMLACFIGIYPAAAILGLFHADLLAQTYKEYLLRGGTPIPVAATIQLSPASPAMPPKIS